MKEGLASRLLENFHLIKDRLLPLVQELFEFKSVELLGCHLYYFNVFSLEFEFEGNAEKNKTWRRLGFICENNELLLCAGGDLDSRVGEEFRFFAEWFAEQLEAHLKETITFDLSDMFKGWRDKLLNEN